MINYRNEAAFSKALVTALRNKGWFVQRIESGETGKGIADIYTVSPTGVAMWLELKRVHMNIPSKINFVDIPWRPGQQAWLSVLHTYKQKVFTLACFDNGILRIPHHTVWQQNLVLIDECTYHQDIRSLLT